MAQTEIARVERRGRAQLISALAESRAGISENAADLADLVNVPKRIRRSLSDTPMKRAATALVAGLVSSKLLFSRSDSTGTTRHGLLNRFFPELDFNSILRLLLKCYLEPEEIDLRALLRERLRDYLD
ncbi:MAG: hypothetical protein ACR2RV_07050 [Verrucomicrobiales bacterium]